MATVLSTGQKIGGVVAASCILFIGILFLVGGVVGWFKHDVEPISEKQVCTVLIFSLKTIEKISCISITGWTIFIYIRVQFEVLKYFSIFEFESNTTLQNFFYCHITGYVCYQILNFKGVQ